MLALLQRVTRARVVVHKEQIAEISEGLLVLLGVELNDTKYDSDKLLKKVIGYRIFEDDKGRMNRSIKDIHGALLVVPQFTLAADTSNGARPSFSPAAPPIDAQNLYNYFLIAAKKTSLRVEEGKFGAHMEVELVNSGPATFILRS